MTLDDLRIFLEVCDAGSLTSVSRSLGCTQPAVSQHVRALERELGQVLLERHARGVKPTPAGLVIRRAALDVLGGLAAAKRELAEIDEQLGSVRIATGGTTVSHFLRSTLRRFRTSFPNAVLEFTAVDSSSRCVDLLLRDAVDLAFLTIDRPVGVDQRHILEMPWCLLLRRDHPLFGQEELDTSLLSKVRWVALPETSVSHRQLTDALHSVGIKPDVVARADNWDTAALLVEAGIGEAVVPLLHALRFTAASVLASRPIRNLPPVHFGWAARRWDVLPARCLAFLDIWRQEFVASPASRSEVRFID
jgi:DNA-binding transcriptional LysR family regulator